ncbi:MAG: hypothetical protein OIF57_06555 [Marinobacterium sp.]|nr:hypothetical protein [Marinobacterium sp.]
MLKEALAGTICLSFLCRYEERGWAGVEYRSLCIAGIQAVMVVALLLFDDLLLSDGLLLWFCCIKP